MDKENPITYAIDFETYYDKQYSITNFGNEGYCAHELFDPYMVSICPCGSQTPLFVGDPKSFDWSLIEGSPRVSHNAGFDEAVYLEMVHRGWIEHSDYPTWHCTADLCSYFSLPRFLSGACEQLLGFKPKKDVRTKMLGRTLTDLNEEETEQLLEYAANDAIYCAQLWEELHSKWPLMEQQVSSINRKAGRRGVRINQELLAEQINTLNQHMWQAAKQIPWEWNKTPLAPTKLKEQCRKAGIPVPKSLAQDSSDCQKWESTYGEKYPWVAAMRVWRRCNILLKKLKTIEQRLRPDGTFPYALKYFGGHTGRFSGSGGFNIQNMPRKPIFGVDLRSLFIPREHKVFYIVDLAQIEARVILWLASDTKTLAQIRSGLSVYEAHAITTMDYKHDPEKTLKEKDPDLYALAKARVLGLGFGCGAKRFQEMAYVLCGLKLSSEKAQQTVAQFRYSNPKIVSLWGALHRDCLRSVRSGDQKTFTVELPSGRLLNYYRLSSYPHLEAEIILGVRKVRLYGGKLAENVTQAVARDILVQGLINTEACSDVSVAWHVHDEIVMEGPSGLDHDKLKKLMAYEVPEMPGLPVEAELIETDKYLK